MDERKLPLTEHLEELRKRLIVAILGTVIAASVCYLQSPAIMEWLLAPLHAVDPGKVKIIGTGLTEAFFTKLKVSVIAGIFLASPLIFHQIWKFVEPGLLDDEKKYVVPFVSFGTLFFVSGAFFCYRYVFPTAFGFFITQYATVALEPFLRISEYLSFSSRMLLAFGVVFELPVFTFFLARTGAVTHRQMMSYWRYAVVAIFVAAAILTPGPDVASQMLMATPLAVLYVLSIGVAWMWGKPPRAAE